MFVNIHFLLETKNVCHSDTADVCCLKQKYSEIMKKRRIFDQNLSASIQAFQRIKKVSTLRPPNYNHLDWLILFTYFCQILTLPTIESIFYLQRLIGAMNDSCIAPSAPHTVYTALPYFTEKNRFAYHYSCDIGYTSQYAYEEVACSFKNNSTKSQWTDAEGIDIKQPTCNFDDKISK